MKATRVPRAAIVIAVVGVAAWWLWSRRRARQAAAVDPNYGGWPIGAVPASFSYLTSAAPAPTETPIGGLNAADSAALAMLQQLTDKLAGGRGGASSTTGGTVSSAGGGSSSGFEMPFHPAGFSDEAVRAAAARYAGPRSYGGSSYAPGMVMQEGHVETRDGVPGVFIKYRTAGGDSTEWTPLR